MTSATLSWVLTRLEEGERVALASVVEASGSVPGKPGARMAVTNTGIRHGTIGGAGLELKVEKHLREILLDKKVNSRIEKYVLYRDAKGQEATALNSLCGGTVTVSLEVLEPMPHILIAGGGHCGQAISAVCENLGWAYSVFDVRNEFADSDLYPNAVEHHSCNVEEFIERETNTKLSRFSDVLLLGHDWSVDQDLLIGLLLNRGDSERPRIGAIGSRAKWKAFKEAAISKGVLESSIDSVRCPIGIDIGAESPEEIAISVCAEIMALDKGIRD